VVSNTVSSSGEINYAVKLFFGTGDSPYYDEDINTSVTTYHFFAYVDENGKGENDENKFSLDWYYELPAGHRVFASAFAAAGHVYFGTVTADTEDPCEASGDSDANDGKIFVFDDTTGTSVLNDDDGNAGKSVGNIYTPPVIYDRHLYVKTPTGLISFGDGIYNNALNAGGVARASKTSWREIF